MRLLLIAYEYPPSPSPGALRWHYLARELAGNGHEVDVLAPRLPGPAQAPTDMSEGVRVHRTFAGPLSGLIEWRSARKQSATSTSSYVAQGSGINWKGRLSHRIKRFVGFFMYPDVRAEWQPWAKRRLDRMLRAAPPDLVISAHEPATTLRLGLIAARRGIPWVADLGDPVLAAYTPRRWRRRAARLERRVCESAQHVVVTTERAKRLLMERHDLADERVSIMTQGFDNAAPSAENGAVPHFDRAKLELLYVGRFYAFRRPDALIEAVSAQENVRLTIVSPELPARCLDRISATSGKIRYLGALPHGRALDLQRRADVLVSIGNDGMDAQTPGKLFEYLGAGKPILHLLASGPHDAAEDLLTSLHAGWVCRNDTASLRLRLQEIESMKRAGVLAEAGAGREQTLEYSWDRIGARYSDLLGRLVNPGPRAGAASAAPVIHGHSAR